MATAKRKPAATPFDALLGMQPIRMPKSGRAVLVLEGKTIHSARDIQAENGLWHPADQSLARSEQQRLRAVLGSVQQAAGYQRERKATDPAARKPSWNDRHPDERRAYMAAYRADPAHRERINASKLAYQKRAYTADPETYRERARRYYAEHRDEILARAAARREAKRLAKSATTTPHPATERTDP